MDFFANRFTSSNPFGMDNNFESIQKRLSEEQMDWCDRPYNREEMKEAIDQMYTLNVPGLNGIPTLFIQKYWHMMRNDVNSFVVNILNESSSRAKYQKSFCCSNPKMQKSKFPKAIQTNQFMQCCHENGSKNNC